jgi:hypothetical protein
MSIEENANLLADSHSHLNMWNKHIYQLWLEEFQYIQQSHKCPRLLLLGFKWLFQSLKVINHYVLIEFQKNCFKMV